MAEMTIRVSGMTCAHCNAAIERAITLIDGVDRVRADFATGRVDVAFAGQPDEPAVREAIEEEGYDVLAVDAPPA